MCANPSLRYDLTVIQPNPVPNQPVVLPKFDVFAKDKGSWRFKCRIPATTADHAKHQALMDFNLIPECVTVYPTR